MAGPIPGTAAPSEKLGARLAYIQAEEARELVSEGDLKINQTRSQLRSLIGIFVRGEAEALIAFNNAQFRGEIIVAKTRSGPAGTTIIWIDAGASTFASQARGDSH
jgi:hypothetical protein